MKQNRNGRGVVKSEIKMFVSPKMHNVECLSKFYPVRKISEPINW